MVTPDQMSLTLKPSMDETCQLFADGVSKRLTLILVGEFRVDYTGRARSSLNFGERILIVKEDGAVLVHRPKGYEPVNWQPGGGILHGELEEGHLVIRAVRRKPREVLKLTFKRVDFLAALRLIDISDFHLYASEEEMREAILTNPDLIEQGFTPIAFEKRIEPGFIDVYGIDSEGRLLIIEIKRGYAGRDAALQLATYINHVRKQVKREVRGILVAPRLRKGVQRMLESLKLEFLTLDPKKCAEVLRRREHKRISEYLP